MKSLHTLITKTVRRVLPALLYMCVCTFQLQAQEFSAKVTLNKTQITNTSLDYLDDLVPLIENYINTNIWTDMTFEEHERIRLNIQVVLNSETSNVFDASLIVSSERPIYNTLQLTPLIVISDNTWRFNFTRNRSLVRDLQQFDDIASVLDFYVYLILALDMDSFSEFGGTEFYRRAQNVVDVAQTTSALGWTSGAGTRRNRFFLISTLNSTAASEYRKAIYRYHRHGLDQFTLDAEKARTEVQGALELIRESRRAITDNYVFDLFFSTKYRELASIFIDAEPPVRLSAYNLLTELDQSHISEYDKLQ